MRKNFDAIDTDHSGSISWDELKAWAKKNHKKGTAADWKKGFDQADANHDGKIEPGEFDKTLQ